MTQYRCPKPQVQCTDIIKHVKNKWKCSMPAHIPYNALCLAIIGCLFSWCCGLTYETAIKQMGLLVEFTQGMQEVHAMHMEMLISFSSFPMDQFVNDEIRHYYLIEIYNVLKIGSQPQERSSQDCILSQRENPCRCHFI